MPFCVGALLHALVLKFTTWLYRRNDIARAPHWLGIRTEREQFMLLVATMSVWYLVAALRDGRTPLNIVAIECVFGFGVWLYLKRAVVRYGFSRRITERLSPPRDS